jgi:hypothetical protein
MRNVLGLALLVCALVACGDNIKPGGPGDIDAPAVDGPVDAPIDAQACTARDMGEVGGSCTADADCDSAQGAGDGLCLNNLLDSGAPWPAVGYCINRLGGCTMDSECGDGNVCVDLGGGARACMQGCSAGPCECPDTMICSDGFVNTPVQRMVCVPGNLDAIDGAPCTTFGDCDEHSICLDDGFEHPGGQCMQLGCALGNDTTCSSGGDGHCSNPDLLGGGTGCLDVCTTNADCREADGYECFDAGGTIDQFCRHPATGDACTADADCGSAVVWECKTGVTFPGGYCTIRQECPTGGSSDGCSPGSSVCHDPLVGANYCVDRCTGVGQGTCRTGYTCQMVGAVRGCI